MGTFLVAENRGNAQSRTILLRFVRFGSTSKRTGPPIVYLAGNESLHQIELPPGRCGV